MLGIFRSRSQNKEIISKLSLQHFQFTLKQKSAIVVRLIELAKVDGNIPANRFGYLQQLLELLDIERDSRSFKKVYEADPEVSLLILKDLWDNQKEWYLMMLYGLIGSQKQQVRQECKRIDVNRQQLRNIVDYF